MIQYNQQPYFRTLETFYLRLDFDICFDCRFDHSIYHTFNRNSYSYSRIDSPYGILSDQSVLFFADNHLYDVF